MHTYKKTAIEQIRWDENEISQLRNKNSSIDEEIIYFKISF